MKSIEFFADYMEINHRTNAKLSSYKTFQVKKPSEELNSIPLTITVEIVSDNKVENHTGVKEVYPILNIPSWCRIAGMV